MTDSVKPWVRRAVCILLNSSRKGVEERRRGTSPGRKDEGGRAPLDRPLGHATALSQGTRNLTSMFTRIGLGVSRNTTLFATGSRRITIFTGGPLPPPRPPLPAPYHTTRSLPPASPPSSSSTR